MTAVPMRFAVASILAAGLLTWLFLRSDAIEPKTHFAYAQELRLLRQADVELNAAILAKSFELDTNFDPVVRSEKSVIERLGNVARPPSFILEGDLAIMKGRVRELQEMEASKLEMVDRFKRENAVLRNSMSYFPTAADRLMHRPALSHRDEIADFIRHMLIFPYHQDLDRIENLEARQQRLLNLPLAADERLVLDQLLQHSRIILNSLPAVSELTRRILSMPTATLMEELTRDYTDGHAKAESRADQYRHLLFLAAVSLFIFVVYSIYHLHKTRLALTIAHAKLEEQFLEAKSAENALRHSEERFKRLLNYSPIAVRIASAKGRSVRFAIPSYSRLINAQSDDMVGTDPQRFYADPSDYDEILTHLASGESVNDRLVELNIPGSGTKWALATYFLFDYEGEPSVLGWFYDVTELKGVENRLRLAASVFTQAREGISITDAEGKIVDVNETFIKITGYGREEVLGKNPRILQSGRQGKDYYDDMWQTLIRDGYWSGEIWNRRKNGEIFAELLSISAVKDANGRTQNYVALFSDITSIKDHQSQLEKIAHFDPLTNLPNRSLLNDRLRQAMAQAQRHRYSLALVYLDLDGFKQINDVHGHQVGDELLITLSMRMKAVLREADTLARIGGDEFVAILVNLEKEQDCEPVLNRLLQASSEPATIDMMMLQVSASIGVTLYPQDGADADLLIRHADQAMYTAKQSGKNRFYMFDPEKDLQLQARRVKLQRLAKALQQGEFLLYYQPKVNILTGEVFGAEALIRWRHPEDGLLPPSEFLHYIDNSELEPVLGEWVIESVLKQIFEWQRDNINIVASANVGARDLLQSSFVDRLRSSLERNPRVSPGQLELEILETAALDDVARAEEVIRSCKALGVQFALDDFGTGYSSLAYFRSLPIDMLKIDQSFVRDMLVDENDRNIVQGVVGLAKAFGRPVIAEGVETLEHCRMLIDMGCHLAQGYGIARPMPADQIPSWISNWQTEAPWKVLQNP